MYDEVETPRALRPRAGAKSTTSLLNDRNDPAYEKREQYAKDYYERVRTVEKSSFIKNVAVNSGMSEKSIEKIFNHIFVEKHALRDGYRRFDPDYDMAESFKRLSAGEDIQAHDLILVKHEWLELGLMKRYGYDYGTAHEITERKYNYDKATDEWLRARGDR